MKFIEDYLSELFGCEVCDVSLDFKSPARVLKIWDNDIEECRVVNGGKGMIMVQISFQAFDNNLPNQKGSLYKSVQNIHYKNLSEYTYKCLQGKETTEMFEYLLGKQKD